jgi:hypothetical protein
VTKIFVCFLVKGKRIGNIFFVGSIHGFEQINRIFIKSGVEAKLPRLIYVRRFFKL